MRSFVSCQTFSDEMIIKQRAHKKVKVQVLSCKLELGSFLIHEEAKHCHLTAGAAVALCVAGF